MTSLYKGAELKYTIWLISKHFWEGGVGGIDDRGFFIYFVFYIFKYL